MQHSKQIPQLVAKNSTTILYTCECGAVLIAVRRKTRERTMLRRGIHQLYCHRAIALDFDNTRIDHQNSLLRQDSVVRERYCRRFFIVTHRSVDTGRRLWRDLYHHSVRRLGSDPIAGVAHLSLSLYDAFRACSERRRIGV
jgi:hypothetical protein